MNEDSNNNVNADSSIAVAPLAAEAAMPSVPPERRWSPEQSSLLEHPFIFKKRTWNEPTRIQRRLMMAGVWLCVVLLGLFYVTKLTRIGIDLRWDFWAYWENNRFYGD